MPPTIRSLALLLALVLPAGTSSAATQAHDEDGALASYSAHLAAAEAALRDGDGGAARAWLAGAPAELRGWEWRMLAARTDESTEVLGDGGEGRVAVDWSPDGERLACATAEGELELWSATTGERLAALTLAGDARPRAVSWSPDGARLACALDDGTLILWDGAGDAPSARWSAPATRSTTANQTPRGVVWHPEGTQLAVPRPGRIDVYDTSTGAVLLEVTGTRPWPLACAAHFSGDRLVTVFWDGRVKVYETLTQTLVEDREPPSDMAGMHSFHDLQFAPSGERIGGALFDGGVLVRDLPSPDRADAFVHGEPEGVRQCYVACFSPDGALLAAGYADGAVRIFDSRTAALVATRLGHGAAVSSLAFAPDGERLASASADGTLRLWSLAQTGGARQVIAAGDSVWSAPFDGDGTRLATAASDGRAVVWDLATGAELAAFGPLSREATSVAFTPDGERLVVASNEHSVGVWEIGAEGPAVELVGHVGGVPNVAVDATGTRAATASYDGSVKLWELASGACLATYELAAYGCAFAPDGSRLLTNDGAELVVIDLATGEETARLDSDEHSERSTSVAWSSDGQFVASGGFGGSLRVWELETGRTLLATDAHRSTLYGIAFHPDGSRFATASYDGTVKLWRLGSPAPLATLRDLPDKAYFVAFDPSGERLAVSTIDGSVTIFDSRSVRWRGR